jgi:hypothetical protein
MAYAPAHESIHVLLNPRIRERIMEKVAGEDKIVEEREKSPPGGPAPRKRQRADTDGASGASFCDDVVTNILARLPARSTVTSRRYRSTTAA